MSKKSLSLYPIDYPFETLVARATGDPKRLILNPDFQRKYKWDKDGNERASRFIESCFMRIPLPACYFAENDKNNHEVIDGVQRITTIIRFLKNEFALEGLTIHEDLNGKKFSELDNDLRNELETTTIRCIILRKENHRELIHEIFARLNQGAVLLSDQEMRHAIYPGNFDKLLVELGGEKVISNFKKSKEKNDRSNEELVLRYFALKKDLSTYKSNLTKWLDTYMMENQKIDLLSIKSLKEDFTKTLKRCITTFGEKPFTKYNPNKPREAVVIYDLLMWSFSELSDEFVDENKNKLKEKFKKTVLNGQFPRNNVWWITKKSIY